MKDENRKFNRLITALLGLVGVCLVVAAASTVTTRFDNISVKYTTTISNLVANGTITATNLSVATSNDLARTSRAVPLAVNATNAAKATLATNALVAAALAGLTNTPADDTSTTTNGWYWILFTNTADGAVLKIRAFPN